MPMSAAAPALGHTRTATRCRGQGVPCTRWAILQAAWEGRLGHCCRRTAAALLRGVGGQLTTRTPTTHLHCRWLSLGTGMGTDLSRAVPAALAAGRVASLRLRPTGTGTGTVVGKDTTQRMQGMQGMQGLTARTLSFTWPRPCTATGLEGQQEPAALELVLRCGVAAARAQAPSHRQQRVGQAAGPAVAHQLAVARTTLLVPAQG